jgi:hypothetical protein
MRRHARYDLPRRAARAGRLSYPNDAPALGVDFDEVAAAKYPARDCIEDVDAGALAGRHGGAALKSVRDDAVEAGDGVRRSRARAEGSFRLLGRAARQPLARGPMRTLSWTQTV